MIEREKKQNTSTGSLDRHTPGVVHDGVEAVSDGQDSAVLKLCADCGLDQRVCLQVHSCCGLVQNQDLGFPQQSSGQADQLALTQTAEGGRRGRVGSGRSQVLEPRVDMFRTTVHCTTSSTGTLGFLLLRNIHGPVCQAGWRQSSSGGRALRSSRPLHLCRCQRGRGSFAGSLRTGWDPGNNRGKDKKESKRKRERGGLI